jgi:predicted AlkP superfamily phosphohydrolase/phosphomutase/Tfp pilus assembly protein PilF
MFQRRWFRALVWLFALGALFYLGASLFMPSSRRLIFGVDKHTGRVRVVNSYVTFLPPHQYYRLSFEQRDGWAQRDGFIRIESEEKVPVNVNYRLRFGIAGDTLPDPRTLVNEGWSAWIAKRVTEAVDAVTQHVSIEELLAPNSRFNAERDPLRRTVTAYLAKSGLKVTAFEIQRIEADRDALLKLKRAELRREARGVAGRVAIFAIDGADWDLISELANDGVIPNIKALAKGGTTGSMQTIQPTVSPMVWTTVATGLSADRHGVIDFVDRGTRSPVDSRGRRAPALWDISESFGRHAMVVNWWTAWPPSSVDSFTFDAPVQLLPDAINPDRAAARARQVEVLPETVGYDQVRRFLNITPVEFERAVSSGDRRDPIVIFRDVLSKTWSDHRVAVNFYNEQQPLVLMVQYDGTDVVNHLFGPFHPPYREDVSSDGYRKYWPAVSNYYSEVDRMIGEWMSVLPADTTVIVMSAYGFRWGKDRPRQIPNGTSALSAHRNPGIFIAYGNHVANSAGTHANTVSIFDIAPTVLAILGLPQSAEMPGQVSTWAFRDITPVKTVRVVSYGEFTSVRPMATTAREEPHAYLSELEAIGHLIDPNRTSIAQLEGDQEAGAAQQLPPEKWGAYAFANNSGVELRKQGKIDEAMAAFQKAIQLNPNRPAPYLNLAMTLIDKQQYPAADDVFKQAVAKGLPNADQWFVDFAAFYRERDMLTRAIALLYKGKELFPQSYVIAANLGSALAAMNRYTEGLPELERALALQPSSTLALNNIGTFYATQHDYARALDFWNRSLAIDPRQPQVRALADAAQSRL